LIRLSSACQAKIPSGVDQENAARLEAKLLGKYFVRNFQFMNNLPPSRAYFAYDAFKDEFPGQQPEFVGR
jgi:hypothetical protein